MGEASDLTLQDVLTHASQISPGLVLYVEQTRDVDALLRGVGALIPQSVHLVRLNSVYLRPGEGTYLSGPLRAGETLVVADASSTELTSHLVTGWTEYLDHPQGTSWTVARGIVFQPLPQGGPDLANAHGLLIIIRIGGGTASFDPGYSIGHDLSPQEITALEDGGVLSRAPIRRVGVALDPDTLQISMKDLCLLHERDPEDTPRIAVPDIFSSSGAPITWTDLQVMLQSNAVKADMFEWLQKAGRIDDRRYGYALAALDFTEARKAEGPRGLGVQAYPDIWEVVWAYEALLEGFGHIFRGQSNGQWPLECTLLRRAEGKPLAVGELLQRIEGTERVLNELAARSMEIFGEQLDEASLLAVAQHFGCPTPLLDYTRSFRVAAFFATLGAASQRADEDVIGVIYHTRPRARDENAPNAISLLELAGIRPGGLTVIEPNIPDENDRIRRQRGIFITGFQARDLQGMAIDRIYFRQIQGVVFEDRRSRVTKEFLQPGTPLANMIKTVIEEVNSRSESHHALLTSVRLPEDRIIGSDGIMLSGQLTTGQDFLESLNQRLAVEGDDARNRIHKVIGEYFRNARIAAEVGNVPQTQEHAAFTPIAIAVAQLAEWSGGDENILWEAVRRYLPPPAGDAAKPYGDGVEFSNYRQRLALACATYLAGWEYLRQVDGDRARVLASHALFLLLAEKPVSTP